MYIVSANYRDRSSKYKWLVRPEGADPKTAIAVAAVVCIGVQVCPSTDYESGFGCSTICKCEDVEYSAEDVEPQVSEVSLKFAGHSFYDPNTGDDVSKMDEFRLGADGSMKAKIVKRGEGKKRKTPAKKSAA
jgi:hypothetical protein